MDRGAYWASWGRERVGHDSATKQQQQTTAPVSINNSFRELTLCNKISQNLQLRK